MRNILSSLTSSEKNRILEMHKTATKNHYLNELESMKPEPVPTGKVYIGTFAFDEGKANMTNETRQDLIDEIKEIIKDSIPTIQKFQNSPFKLPKMFEVNVGTSSTGTPEANASVAKKRKSLFEEIIKSALRSFNIREDIIEKIYSLQSTSYYTPSKLDFNFYDARKIKPNDKERFGVLKIMTITTMGLNDANLNVASFKVQSPDITKSKSVKNPDDMYNLWGLWDSGYHTEYYIEPDQDSIYAGVKMIKTYSDVKDLNSQLVNARKGGVAKVINDKLTDPNKFIEACSTIKKAFERSGKSTTAVDCRRMGDLYIEF